MNMDITSMLRTILFICLSFFLISCGSDEETPPETKLLPDFYDLVINFTQAEQDLGVINIQPSNLVCKTTCTSNIAADTVVELSATPKAGTVFVEWGGDCSGNASCQLTMSSAHTVTALFADAASVFTLALQAKNGGSVTLSAELGECTNNCEFTFIDGTEIELNALPDADFLFSGWTDACSGNSSCLLTMSEARIATATFEKETANTLSTEISTGGSISLQEGALNCSDSCKFNLLPDELINVIATPEYGYTFKNWLGDCTGTEECQVTINGAKAITANFKKLPIFPLTSTVSVGGSISLKGGSLTCAAATNCSFDIIENEAVIIKPLPASGYIFTGWEGDCTGSSTCELTMSAEHNISAVFIEIPTGELLSLQMTLGGSIAVADANAGAKTTAKVNDIGECFIDCQLSFANSETLAATALPETGYTFTGWSGDCTGDATCQIKMSTAHSITASFEAFPVLSLKISIGGSITLADGLGDCNIDCEISLPHNEVITITAIPGTGYIFSGWDGDCGLELTCQLTMSSDSTTTATFIEIPAETTLSLTMGDGGSVTLSDNLGDCAIDCQLTFTQQEVITLTATAEAGYIFHSWGGNCAGDATCLVTMTSDHNVSAIFKPTSHTCAAQAPLPATSFDADPEYAYHNPANDGSRYETLLTDFVVKESSGKGASNYPVSMVFPVEQGLYFHPGDFHIKNSAGEVIPAQFNVINRWWAKDRSLRHIQAHFNVDIDAYTVGQADTGVQAFNLYSGNGNIKPNYSVCATESDTEILVNNGLVDITITKSPLTITTPAGQLKSIFIKENGETDYSFDHDNIKIELEEIGYLRTIVKISSLTNYVSPTDIKHGWAIRLYMYANSDKVKVDFQLQNSAINTQFSAPLYFKSHQLVLENTGTTESQLVKADKIDGDNISSGLSGAISSPKVNVFFRDFWQKFPQGLATATDGKLSIELWPSWSKQFLDADFAVADFYWLDDMRQTYKEVLLDFSTQNQTDYLDTIARNFQYSPVASLPQVYYAKTSVTLELGGYFPTSAVPTEEYRVPQYVATDFSDINSTGQVKFGQDNYGLDLSRKKATNGTGGWAYSKRHFFISGNPRDSYSAQNLAQAEINIRPQWLSGYTHANNFAAIQPSANPYGGTTWRSFHQGSGKATLTRSYIDGSSQAAKPRDDQHAWFYHLEHAYLMSGNKWLKDWYQFMAEFKQVYLQELDPWPDRSNRAEGHNLSVALSAYRVTGNLDLGMILSRYTTDVHSKYLLAPHNLHHGGDWGDNPKASLFQLGYLVKPFIDLTYEFPEQVTTIGMIRNNVDWNYTYANFSYYRSILDYSITTQASGSSLTFVDAAIWYALYSGEQKYADHAINFVQSGIGGRIAYGTWGSWLGQYEGQIYNYYLQNNN